MKAASFISGRFLLIVPVIFCSFLTTAFTDEIKEARPFLAIWRQSDGFVGRSQAPYLRIAIWNDGRMIFARDSKKWDQDLLQGRIDDSRVAELKKALERTGVFDLKGNCYLVPDAPVDCVMLDFGTKQQILYWDEIESANYGINSSSKPRQKALKSCWKEINRLALGATPKQSEPYPQRFQAPASWQLKPAIQSQ